MDSSAHNSVFHVPDSLCPLCLSPVWRAFWDGEGSCQLLGHPLIHVSSYQRKCRESAEFHRLTEAPCKLSDLVDSGGEGLTLPLASDKSRTVLEYLTAKL